MDVLDALDAFDFDDDLAINDEVQSIAAVELEPVVGDGQRSLSLDVVAAFAQFVAEAGLVRGFEQAGAERTMHGDGGADHGPGHRVIAMLDLAQPLPHAFLCALGASAVSPVQINLKSVITPIEHIRT